MWYLASVVHADHEDVVLTDVQMCSVPFRSCDHDEDGNTHPWIPNKNQNGCQSEIQFLQSDFLKNMEFYHKFRYNNEFI